MKISKTHLKNAVVKKMNQFSRNLAQLTKTLAKIVSNQFKQYLKLSKYIKEYLYHKLGKGEEPYLVKTQDKFSNLGYSFGFFVLVYFIISLGSQLSWFAPLVRRNLTGEHIFSVKNTIYASEIGIKDTKRPEVTFEVNGHTLVMAPLDADLDALKVVKRGRKVIFKNLEENIDVSYQTLTNGLKEEIIIKEPTDKDTYVFRMRIETPNNESLEGNFPSPAFFDNNGDYLFHFEKPFAVDASGNRTDDVLLQVGQGADANDYQIRLVVDKDWLSDESRSFPITIDPTIVHDTTDEFKVGSFNRSTDSASPQIETDFQELAADENTTALWHMDEEVKDTCSGGTNDICDSSGNGNDGAFAADATFTSSSKIGESATTYDGTGDYTTTVTATTLGINDPTKQFSIEFWFKSSEATEEYMFDNYDGGAHSISMRIDGGKIETLIKDAGSNTNGNPQYGGGYNDDNWHHLGFTWNNGKEIVYADGEKIGQTNSTAVTGSLESSTAFWIGDRPSVGAAFNGQIDELRVSTVERTPEEIKASASRRPYAIYTSSVIDLGGPVNSWVDLSWSENGVTTGDGETVGDSTNLVAQWNLNETSGTAANNDAEGTSCGGTPANCDGTLSGFDSTTSQDADPDSTWTADNRRWGAGALKFDGTNSIVTVSDDNSLDFTTAFTISMWFKRQRLGTDEYLLSHNNPASTFNGYSLHFGTDNIPEIWTSDGTGAWIDVLNGPVIDLEWHHLVVTLGSSTIKGYLDGKIGLTTTSGVNDSAASTNPLYIGADDDGAQPFMGIIDAVQLYNDTLTEAEVIQLHNSSNVQFETRVGPDTSPGDNDWEAWAPTTNETQIDSFDSSYLYSTTESGLTHYFPMDETADGGCSGGEDMCDVKGSYHATDQGTTIIADGKFGKARDFDGSTDYFTSTTSPGLPTGDFTYEAWIYPHTLNEEAIFMAADGSGGNEMLIQLGSTNKLEVYTNNSLQLTSTTALNAYHWYHITVTRSSSTITAYINGVADATTGSDGVALSFSTCALMIGGEADATCVASPGNYFDGIIDEARVYSSALSAATVRDHWLEGVTIPEGFLESTDSNIFYEGTASKRLELGNTSVHESTYALFHMDETNGDNGGDDLFNESTIGADGEFTGTSVVNGVKGKARSFNGSSDYIAISAINPGNETELTVEAWVKFNSLSGTQNIVGEGGSADGWALGTDGTNLEFVITKDFSAYVASYALSNLRTDHWYHISGIYLASTLMWLNVDGQTVASSGTYPTQIDNPAQGAWMGLDDNTTYVNGQGYFSGELDEVRVMGHANVATGRILRTIQNDFRMGENYYLNNSITSTDLSDDNQLTFYVAADQPGTYLEAIVGETELSNLQPDANTQGYWRFDGPTGSICGASGEDACDFSGNYLHTNHGSNSSFGYPGQIGYSEDFDGSADYEAISSGISIDNSDFSISSWARRESTGTNDYIFGQGTTGGYTAFTLGFRSTNVFTCSFYTTELDTVATYTDDNWHLWTCTYDVSSNERILYRDGVEIASDTAAADYTGTGAAYIGAAEWSPSGTYFDGQIDDTFVTTSIMTPEEVRSYYEASKNTRVHPITIDFGAGLDSDDVIDDSSDLSFTVDATTKGAENKGANLYAGDKIIIKERVDATEYLAQGTVELVNTTSGHVNVGEWDTTSTFPSGGYTSNATVFKWQKEYMDLSDIALSTQIDAVDLFTLRVTDNNQGRTVWIDDLASAGDYMTTNTGSTIGSSTGKRFFQYKSIISSSDEDATANLTDVTFDYKTDAPSLFWKFDENYGSNAYDHSLNALNGTITNATWAGSDLCLSRSCLEFDGASDYVTEADNDDYLDFAAADDFTIEGWFRHPAIATTDDVILAKYEGTGGDGGYRIDMASDGDIAFKITDENALPEDTATSTTADYDDDRWHHFAAVKNGTTSILLYVDGIEVGSDSTLATTGTLANDDALYVGIDGDGAGEEWDGFLDEIKIFGHARSAAQIKADFLVHAGVKGASAGFGPDDRFLSDGLVGYWKLDEQSGTAADSSGNVNTLTNNGTTTYTWAKFGNGSEHVPASSQYLSTVTAVNGVKTVSFWVNPDNTTNYYIDLDGSAYIDSTTGTIAATGFTDATIYVNGVETSTIAADVWSLVTVVTDTAVNATAFNIGKISTNYFDGTMDEVRLYSKAFTPREVERLYGWTAPPVGYWPMDEGSGTTTTYDKSGLGNDGTLTSMTEDSWTTGKFGGALAFDGSADYYSIVDGTFENTIQSFTWTGWVYFDNLDGVTAADVVLFSSLAGDANYPRAYVDRDDGDMTLQLRTGGVTQTVVTPGSWAVTNNNWHYITFTFEAATNFTNVYVDGNLSVTKTWSAGTLDKGTTDMIIGFNANKAEYHSGKMDEVKLYNYVRSPGQVVEDMNGGNPIGGSPIGSEAVYWKLDEQSGSTANDTMTNTNGTITGANWLTESSCKRNGCLNFDAAAEVVTIATADDDYVDFNGSEPFSASAWVYSTTMPGSGEQDAIIVKWDETSIDDQSYELILEDDDADTTGNFQVDLFNETDTQVITATGANDTVSQNTWHHVAFTFNGGEAGAAGDLKLYVDGVKVDENAANASFLGLENHTVDFTVGEYDTNDSEATNTAFTGRIDEVKVYSDELTAAQVLIDMNGGSAAALGGVLGDSEAADIAGGAGANSVAYYPMDENSGTSTTADKSGIAVVDATMTGTMTESDWVNGKVGTALDFDGSDDALTVATASDANVDFNSTEDFSGSAWVYIKTMPGSSNQDAIITKYDETSTLRGYRLVVENDDADSTGNFQVEIYDESADQAITASGANDTVSENTWYHVLFTFNGGVAGAADDLELYTNGVLTARNTVNASFLGLEDVAVDFSIGDYDVTDVVANNTAFTGIIDNVLIHDYVLSPAQVAYQFNRGRPVGWWKLDDCSGTTIDDNSIGGSGLVNSNNGTWSGSSGTNTSAGTCGSGTGTEAWNNGTTGKLNYSLDFDGTDDVVTITNASEIDFDEALQNGMTFTGWIYANSDGEANVGEIFDKGATTFCRTDNESGSSLDLQCSLNLDSGGSDATLNVSAALTLNTWHHIAMAYTDDGDDEITLYVDGVDVGSSSDGSGAPQTTDTDNILIGGDSAANFDGQIDDFRVYSYELSAAQVRRIMLGEAAVRYGPLEGSP